MDFDAIDDPLSVLDEWHRKVTEQGDLYPDAMTLSTIGLDGAPRARVVLFKGRVDRGLHFYTNYESDKGKELERDPRAALTFFFPTLGRQVRIQGTVSKLSAQQSDAYFATRPRPSQIGAWASEQSRPLQSRGELENRVEELNARFRGEEVPRPPHWGGYELTATVMELWLGHEARLHERLRFVYRKEWLGPQWLQP